MAMSSTTTGMNGLSDAADGSPSVDDDHRELSDGTAATKALAELDAGKKMRIRVRMRTRMRPIVIFVRQCIHISETVLAGSIPVRGRLGRGQNLLPAG
jgi:hypothetical protein